MTSIGTWEVSVSPTRKLLCLTVVTAVLASCGTRQPATQIRSELGIRSDRIFIVNVDKGGSPGKCDVTVSPDTGPLTQVEAGWDVSWVLNNRCDDTQDIKLTFVTKNGKTPKTPIQFRPFKDGVLNGKVHRKGFWNPKRYENGDKAPCVEYEYTVTVGTHAEDPDFEIIVY
jgi:hypothetical protein